MYRIDGNAEVYLGPATVTGAIGEYRLVTDFAKYTVKEIDGRKRLIGVALRITANVKTKKAGVHIGTGDLGAAFKGNAATGSLSFEVHGASSALIDQLWPRGSVNINEAQTQRVFDARDKIITALRTLPVVITPRVLGTQQLAHTAQLPVASVQSGEVSFSVNSGAYPGAKQVPNSDDKDTDHYQISVPFPTAFSRAPAVQVSITGLNLAAPNGWFLVRAVNISPSGFDLQLKHWHGTPMPNVIVVSWTALDK